MNIEAGVKNPSNDHLEIRERWQDALELCRKELGPEDYNIIMSFQSPDEMFAAIESKQKEAKESSISRLLRQFKPRLQRLKTFAVEITVGVGLESPQTACVWGVVTLMLELALRSEEIMAEITAMWADISNSLQIFEVYKDFAEHDTAVQEVLFDVLVDLLLFAVFTIQTVKRIRFQNSSYRMLSEIATWNGVKSKFRDISGRISQKIFYIKEKAEAIRITNQEDRQTELMNYLAHQVQEEPDGVSRHSDSEISAMLPCYYVPYPPNSNFVGRESIMTDIKNKLEPSVQPESVQSTALWAEAGIGKTQIALEYVNRRRRDGLQAIFWIPSEDESETAKSFTEIAEALQLAGATSSKGHDQNRLLVLRWLQQTKSNWLVIYDNVDDQMLLSRIWPSCGRGSILVTCRSELLAASSSASSIAIPPFSSDDGGRLLLQELGLDQYTTRDLQLAVEFSNTLGGHALAIDLMARNMRARKKTLEQFIHSYEENPRKLHKNPRRGIRNIYYEKDLASMWSIAFSQLDRTSARLFGILCMLAPDNLPANVVSGALALFANGSDVEEFEEKVLEFIDLALLKASPELKLLSVHRLIQGEFRASKSIEDQRQSFQDTTALLHQAFPQQVKGFALFNKWSLCESLIEHVQVLCKRYREISDGCNLGYLEDFVYLTTDSSRYLLEIGRYNAALNILSNGFHHCTDDRSLPFSNLCVTMSTVLCERGRDRSAIPYHSQCLQIRENLLPPNHSEIANALSNYALSLVGMKADLDKAVEMLLKSLEIDMANSKEDRSKVLHLRHYNLCFAYRTLGDFDNTRAQLELATAYVEEEFGKDSRYLNITYRILSDFKSQSGEYDEAYSLSQKALTIAQCDAETTPWVSASLYKLGCIRLKQRRIDDALKLFHEALLITRLNEREKGDQGETARILNKLSEALWANCQWSESNKARQEAERLYEELISSGEYTETNDEQKWDYLVCLKFR